MGIEVISFRVIMYMISFLILRLIFDSDQTFLEWWCKWDATNYLAMARGGYKEIVIDGVSNMGDGVLQTLVFFPLYSWLMRLLNIIVNNMELTALLTSTLDRKSVV